MNQHSFLRGLPARTAIALGALLAACSSTTGTPGDTSAQDAAADSASVGMDVPVAPTDAQPMGPDVYDPFRDPDARSPSTAITAPNEQWTWVDFPDAVCGNGSATGIGVNLTTRSRHVFIFMNGGGACWDATTCYTLATAAHLDGYGQPEFQSDLRSLSAAVLFSRTDMRNPFRDASWVFVPYCTGDVHMGDNIKSILASGQRRIAFFEGYRNMTVFLRRLVPTFATADRIWLTGSSAGGVGSLANFDQTQRAFGDAVRVDVIDDSGPPITPVAGRWAQWVAAWNPQFPAGCTDCATNLNNALDYYERTYGASHRMALLSYTQDGTISQFLGVQGTDLQVQLQSLWDRFAMQPGIGFYYLNGTTHTMFGNVQNLQTSTGVQLLTWLNQMVSDDPAWHSVGP
jgi:hypothetical protein